MRIDQLSEKEKDELLALLEAERAYTFRREMLDELMDSYLKRVDFSTFHSEIRIVMHRASAEVIAQRVAEMELEFAGAKAELAAAHREPESEGGEAT